MKTALISFRNISENYIPDAEQRLVWAFNAGGISVDYIELLPVNDDLGFNKRFGEITETADNVIILCRGELTFDVKEFICKKFGLQTEENSNAKKFVREYNIAAGVTGNNDYFVLPEGSIVIPNFKGAFQGYMTESDGLTVTVLPADPEMFETMCVNYVLPYFEKKYKIRYDKLTIKMFGVSDKELSAVLKKAAKNRVE